MTICSPTGVEAVFAAAGIEVLAAKLDLAPHAVRSLSGSLCEAEQRRALRFRLERDGRRFVVARARLRQLLGARLGLAPEAVALTSGKNGKPALAPACAGSGWSFNVSHSGELALCAFARGREVGVDVEAIRPVGEADAIVARFFSPHENEAYRRHAAHERPLAFLRWWTRKEALAKALGDGLDALLDRSDLDELSARQGWRIDSFSPLPGFIAAVASHQR